MLAMLDPAPFTSQHLYLFFLVFAVVASLLYISTIVRLPNRAALAARPGVRYAGGVLAAAVAAATSLAVPWPLAAGLACAVVLLIIIGRWDEKTPLSPLTQLAGQGIIAAVVVGAGWSIAYISHPWSEGVINLTWIQAGPFTLPAAAITIVWLVLLMNAMNWLDGTDGLAPGVAAAGFAMLAAVSLLPQIQSSTMLALAAIGTAAALAFTIGNWPPARIFLGTSGSWFLGLYLGLVGLTGGGKIVTTAVILAWPVLDVAAVILQRLQHSQPPWRGDRQTHVHYRLLAAGTPPSRIALLAIGVTLVAGIAALALSTVAKIVVLLVAASLICLASLQRHRPAG